MSLTKVVGSLATFILCLHLKITVVALTYFYRLEKLKNGMRELNF